jgi:flagellar biosynthesis protein FlhA
MAGLLARIQQQGDVILAFGVFGLLALMIVPLPAILLDMLLAASIGLSILLFLGALYADKPVQFSAFPTLLLVSTVFRLGLNVASTRLILLNGSEGPAAAGDVIQAFGQFVVGGNYVVGGILFLILVLINFVVITKGSGRIAEVSARFTLDAMPGKQMAIDAELNAGLIDEVTAKARRAEVAREADFYGAMDGASKFVRGDAIAGIVITIVNVLGGVAIGVLQEGMPVADAMKSYTILTIGDGLAGQIPALIISTAAGLLVTRVDDIDDRRLAGQFAGQLVRNPKSLGIGAALLGSMALLPGLHLPFSLLALAAGGLAWHLHKNPLPTKQEKKAAADLAKPKEAKPEDLFALEPLAIEVSVDLVYLVDERHGGELLQRVQKLRNQFVEDMGLVLPPVHLRDNLSLENGQYAILLQGERIGTGRIQARQHLALDPGTAHGKVDGLPTTDPVFGLPAYWILDRHVLEAQSKGFTVVDAPTVLTTHLVELMNAHGYELFDGAQLDKALDHVAQLNPKLVDDLVPDPLPRHAVLKVFRNLLKEGVSIRDTARILETLAEYAARTRDADVLTEFVRQRMARHITGRYLDEQGQVAVVQLGPDAEDAVLRGLASQDGAAPTLQLEPAVARALIMKIGELVESYSGGSPAVVLCPPLARGALRRLLERVLPRVTVVSSAELLPSARLRPVGVVSLGAR